MAGQYLSHMCSSVNIMLVTSREVRIGKNCAEYGPRPAAEDTVFPNMDQPGPVKPPR